jgi:hypothetical protein
MRGGTGTEMRRAGMSHVTRRRVSGQVRGIGEDRVRMVSGGVVLGQAVVGLMGRRLVERGRPAMLKRGPVVVRLISVRSLGLLGRMRLLRRVVDMVISYTVVVRQRASTTWVPPERTALAGRRTLNRNNLYESSPLAGLRWRKLEYLTRVGET